MDLFALDPMLVSHDQFQVVTTPGNMKVDQDPFFGCI